MLIDLHPILHAFARQKEETVRKPLTRQQWINADRIVMLILFAGVVIATVIFS